MDNSFGSFEYLPANNTDVEADQFFVVQDDGTFLLNRQVQYVAEVQDVKEALDGAQACTVYDVSPQQFFVDVTDNSTELISVADNYILPGPDTAAAGNNIYENSFLLQTVTAENSDQGDRPLPIQLDNPNEPDRTADISKQNSTCTQITITDEQYKCLQEKGRVLLELTDKIYLLDSFGLHDITANTELIQTLRDDSCNYTTRTEESDIQKAELKSKSNVLQNEPPQQNVVDFITQDDKILEIDLINEDFVKDNLKVDFEQETSNPPVQKEVSNVNPKREVKSQNVIKIKTKYCFKDIPDKVFLGKTKNGKKLVAKLISCTKKQDQNKDGIQQQKLPFSMETMEPRGLDKDLNNTQGILDDDDHEFGKFLQKVLNGEIVFHPEQLSAAREILSQLIQVPAFRSSVAGRNVIITKAVENKFEKAVKFENSTTCVTGVVTSIADGNCCFVHVPDLLQKLAHHIDAKVQTASRSVLKPMSIKDYTVLHVQICETKHQNNVESISVILNERMLPWHPLKEFDITTICNPSRQATRLFACSSCATIYATKQELLEHQETHSLEAEDELTIDTDKLPKSLATSSGTGDSYTTVKTERGTQYACLQCLMKFNKESNCIRHVKTHMAPEIADSENENTSEPTKSIDLYKCKMCACSYFHSSALTKHISKVHITNNMFTKTWKTFK